MSVKFCSECGQSFETSNDSDECFDCTLKRITGGTAPEEGDFNSARIQSGTMSDDDWKLLQQDLCAVEGYSSEMEDEYYEGSQFDNADEYCLICGKRECYCDLQYEDDGKDQGQDPDLEREWGWACCS